MNILRLVNIEPDKDGDGVNEYEFFETVYISEYDELGVPCTLEGEYADRCGAEEAHLVNFDRRPGRTWEERIWQRSESHKSLPITVWGM